MAVNALLAPFFGAGFYYKTFMWPAAFWEKLYEPLIRRAAGLGRASRDARSRPLREGVRRICDVLVIGVGPGRADGGAGRRARGRACHPVRGGFPPRRPAACRRRRRSAARPRRDWAESAVAELSALPNVRLMRRTTVFGVYDGGTYGAVERVNDHVAAPPAHRAAPARLAHRGKACGAGGRRDRAPHGVRRQRPARRHAGRRGAHAMSIALLSLRAGAPSSSPTVTTAGARRRTWRTRASASRRWSTRARTRDSVRMRRWRSHCRRHGREGARQHRCLPE